MTEDASLTRMTDILAAGFSVPATPYVESPAEPTAATEDLFYIFGAAPIAVHVWDDLGNHTGPITPTHFSEIEYNVPGASYWHNDLSVSLSLKRGTPYTLKVEAPVATTRLRIVRVIPDQNGTNEQVFFPDQTVATGGSLQLLLDAAGTPSSEPLDVDADGDGTYEDSLPPLDFLTSTQTGPALPEPHPWDIQVTAAVTDTVDKQIEITIPAVDTTWQWEASSGSAWITPLASAGQSPATVAATLASTTLPAGIYTGTLDIVLSHGDYQVTYPITVRLTVTGGNLAVALASFTADAQADGIRIGWETTTEINNVGFNLYRAEVGQRTEGPAQRGVDSVAGARQHPRRRLHLAGRRGRGRPDHLLLDRGYGPQRCGDAARPRQRNLSGTDRCSPDQLCCEPAETRSSTGRECSGHAGRLTRCRPCRSHGAVAMASRPAHLRCAGCGTDEVACPASVSTPTGHDNPRNRGQVTPIPGQTAGPLVWAAVQHEPVSWLPASMHLLRFEE